MVDITRLRKNSEKKSVSVSSAEIMAADIDSVNLQELFNIPANCLIIDAGMIVEELGQADLLVDFGIDGGAELGNDLDAHDALGYVDGAALTASLPTGTGATITAKFSAIPTLGKWYFIVEYIEYTLGNGDLTTLGSGT